MTTTYSQTVLMNDLTPVLVVSLSNISGTYYNGSNNNGIGATLTVAASSLTVDGVALAVGDRLLLQNQSNGYENGIYVVSSIGSTVVLKRAFDSQSIEQLKKGQFAVVGSGYNAGLVFSLVSPLPQVIGTDTFYYVSGSPLNAEVAITAAEFNGMYAAPKAIIPAPGENKLIVVDSAELLLTYGSAQYANGGVVGFQYDSTVNGAGVKATNTEQASDFTGATASTAYLFNLASGNSSQALFSACVNKGLYLSNQTAAFITGTGSSWVAKVKYHIVATA